MSPRSTTPDAAAEHLATHALLNCYARETPDATVLTRDALAPDLDAALDLSSAHALVVPLRTRHAALVVGLSYRSPTLRHQFALPAQVVADDGVARRIDLPQLTELLVDELAAGEQPVPVDATSADTGLAARVLDSTAAIADTLTGRADDVDRLWSAEALPFVDTEQGLLIGHMVHPTPKSRGEMSADERRAYSPEAGARVALDWLAVDPALVAHDSACTDSAPDLALSLLRTDPLVDHDALDRALASLGPRVLLPAHPWEAAMLRADPAHADLYDSRAIVALGALGSPYAPTSSVRTLYRRDAAFQCKFSLHVRMTNSMRVTLPKELGRAVESARLAHTEIGDRARAVAPDFVLLQDPAYLTVHRHGEVVSGYSVLLRENRWGDVGALADATALTTLCQDHPYGEVSRLGAIVRQLAARTGDREQVVAREWFRRFCDVVVVSLVRLYVDVGLCFEAHQQNTLIEMEGGWPVRGVYRDSQGYFHRAAAHDDFVRVIPAVGEVTESIFPEDLADERLVYYLFVNMTLGVVNALGTAGVVDEHVLLVDLRALLERERARPGRYPPSLLDRLLDDGEWPCKGNLRTRFHGMDELVGDISTQSVYVTVANPLQDVPA
ncbi:MAG: IucA/IucC family protein [Acidimicrobiia bacterium]